MEIESIILGGIVLVLVVCLRILYLTKKQGSTGKHVGTRPPRPPRG